MQVTLTITGESLSEVLSQMGNPSQQQTAAPAATATNKTADKKTPAAATTPPASTPAAPPPAATTRSTPTAEDLRAAWMVKKNEGCKAPQLGALLESFEIKSLSETPEDKRTEVLNAINALKK